VSADVSWDSLAAGLPVHDDEVMAAHQGAPSVAVQSDTHGAPAPQPDHGDGDSVSWLLSRRHESGYRDGAAGVSPDGAAR
jgi:hypothetical protein